MQIIYLDQNKWIELARAWKHSGENEALAELGVKLADAVQAKRVCLPLTAANIYETYKINDKARRADLALVQASLSGGRVFVGRRKRLTAEVTALVCSICGLSSKDDDQNWFLSDLFFEAFVDHDDGRLPPPVSENVRAAIRANPRHFLLEFWVDTPDEKRRFSVKKWSEGSCPSGLPALPGWVKVG